MRAGKLRHLVNLIRQHTAKNAYGEDVVTWTTDKTGIWASI